ncbi:MAG: HNH endonuclease [Acidobacteriota bacterium]
MDHTLVLNATYEPLQIVPWKRAMRMLFQEKVEVVAEYDRVIHSVSLSMRLPSVLRLHYYVKVRRSHHQVKFTRANIYARDSYRCQYCGSKPPSHDLTYDHVLPVAQGGQKTWENIITCCVVCNRRKGGQTPEQAGLRLLRQPKAPSAFPHKIHFYLYHGKAPDSWKDYIFWNGHGNGNGQG